MITKEQFLAGVEFSVKKESCEFKYISDSITKRSMSILDFRYYGNVSHIDDDGFKCFTFLFDKRVEASISFSDCTAIVNEPATAEINSHE